MGKYEPLPQFLKSRSSNEVRLDFSDIESILGFSLPQSAYRYEAWWSNNPVGHSHAKSWLAAGWRTEAVDLAARKVTFVHSQASRGRKKMNPFGCMKGTVMVHDGTDLTMPSGDVWNAEQGLLLNG